MCSVCIGGVNVRIFVLRSKFLALLFVHVHGDGKAFPEGGIANAGHDDLCVRLLIYVLLAFSYLLVLGR